MSMFSEKKYSTHQHRNNRSNHPLIPMIVIGSAVLAAIVFWTVPTWVTVWPHLAQLSVLWQTDQRAVLLLLVKLCSPLLIGLLFGAGFQLWQLIGPYLRRAAASLEHPQAVFEHAHHHFSTNRSGHRPTSTDQLVFPSVPKRRSLAGEVSSPDHPVVPLLPSLIHSGSRLYSPSVRNGAYKREQAVSRLAQVQKREAPTHVAILRTRRQERFHSLYVKRSVRKMTKEAQESVPTVSNDHLQVQVASPDTVSVSEVLLAPGSGEEELYGQQDVPSPLHTVTIRLLHHVSLMLHSQGISRQVSFALNAKRVILLAYIACQRGKEIQRDRLLEHVFGHGRDDEDATREKLGEAFDSHKKLMRLSLRETINQMNAEAGYEVLSPDLSLFTHRHKLYSLSDICSVVDLEAIEAEHQIIEQARKQGLLADAVPLDVKQACDRLIAAYTGDFLEELIVNYLEEFQPWASSWAREPYTLYRDYYLEALWYSAEYELHRGQEMQTSSAEGKGDLARRKQRRHWELAAQHYRAYAMKACDSRFDLKVTFKRPGERTIMSERALRRCLVLYGSIGATHLVDQVYAAYSQQMREVSGKAWEPSAETLADLQAAKEHTCEYRFPSQIALHEPGHL